MDRVKKIISADEFVRQMRKITKELEDENNFTTSDEELYHEQADELMCLVLESLGYGEGVSLFRTMCKWYA